LPADEPSVTVSTAFDPSQTYVGFFHSIPRRAPESENRSEAENTGLMLAAILDPILIIGCSTSR
jgi:hypothetical protein